jgi:CcmD family protein
MNGKRERAKGTWHAAAAILLIALFTVVVAPAASMAQPQPQPSKPAAQDGFVPIDQLAPKEELPAAPLVMAAYAVAWLVVFGYIWSLWRRLQKVEAELADVNRRVAGGARR